MSATYLLKFRHTISLSQSSPPTQNILFSGSLVVVSAQQKFLETPQSLISAPGNQVTLTCLVQNKGGECRWQKDGKVTK